MQSIRKVSRYSLLLTLSLQMLVVVTCNLASLLIISYVNTNSHKTTSTLYLLQDQLGDVLHWIRQALGLIFGLVWGVIPLVGGIWFLL